MIRPKWLKLRKPETVNTTLPRVWFETTGFEVLDVRT